MSDSGSILLAAYRLAWLLLLPAIRLFASVDAGFARIAGHGLMPGRWRVAERLGYGGGAARPGSGGALWLHCASLGEAKGMWALASALGGTVDVLVTATTADGAAFLEERCRRAAGDAPAPDRTGTYSGPSPGIRAGMAPLDHPGLVRRFLEANGVRGLCLYEAEIWPHYLSACRAAGLPAALVSGRLSPRAFRAYSRFAGAASSLLGTLAFIEAQSAEDAARYSALLGGSETPVRMGTDFKAAHYLGSLPMPALDGDADTGGNPIRRRFAFLSLHPAELAWFRKSLPDLMRRFDLAVFPRHMGHVERFRTVLEPLGFSLHSRDPDGRHLLVDSLGRIGTMIRECHSAFVGGSLVPAGCHNLWEPLLGGLKTYFGPNHGNQEPLAGRMLRMGLAEVVEDPARAEAWRVPEAGIRTASAILAEEARRSVDSAMRDCAGAIFATFYGTGRHAADIHKETPDFRTQG